MQDFSRPAQFPPDSPGGISGRREGEACPREGDARSSGGASAGRGRIPEYGGVDKESTIKFLGERLDFNDDMI